MQNPKEKIAEAWTSKNPYLPSISVDCVIFGYHQKQLKILCTKPAGFDGWLLPGGYVELTENLDDAANRVLDERTGVSNIFLKQFKIYGDKNRAWNHPIHAANMPIISGVVPPEREWMMGRFVSVGYYALTDYSKVKMKATLIEGECAWCDIHELPHLLLDHSSMVQDALKTLRLQMHYEPIGYNLLPDKFTLPEMLSLYETILEKKIDHRNFNKKLLSLGIVRKLSEKKNIGGHRAPSLYKFNKRTYDKVLREGMVLIF